MSRVQTSSTFGLKKPFKTEADALAFVNAVLPVAWTAYNLSDPGPQNLLWRHISRVSAKIAEDLDIDCPLSDDVCLLLAKTVLKARNEQA